MQVSVVETLENGANFRFTVIFGRELKLKWPLQN